ncbi:abortive infection protein [Sulfuricella denitrificans skB26]|uniref:Abortive infection protein n=1 Tax=Sulfuricella denitrificans (strain DSM 22764 / NBRC 105220 / skB26) TaxID=1163617 RepID=S6AKM2_SULDS|nr:JDVT-CTERM system glutamic-type intramembrane protease [Sulfuricella denitrificans]BAN35144.1 abortive infection protein [Sulfuricella denitrificans skB26]
MLNGLLADVGLAGYRPFYRDRQFMLALLAGMVVWLAFWQISPGLLPTFSLTANVPLFLSLVIGQPVLEELLFRGVVQGQFRLRTWGGKKRWGMTQANLLTSVLFVLAHAFYHPPLWALAVFVPSLVFGHFRDRVGNIYPSLALHVYYNMGFFCLGRYISSP